MSPSAKSSSKPRQAISGLATTQSTRVVKKVKVQNNGAQIKKLAAIVNKHDPATSATPVPPPLKSDMLALEKKPEAMTTALPPTPTTLVTKAPEVQKVAPNPAESQSLQHMRNHVATLEQCRKSLEAACAILEPLKADNDAVKKAVNILEQQTEIIGANSANLPTLKDYNKCEATNEVQPPAEDASPDEAIMAGLFGEDSFEVQPPPQHTLPSIATTMKPSPSSSRPKPNLLSNPKRKDSSAPISRPQRSMGTIDPTNTKATSTILIDGITARRAEVIAIEAEKKQTGKKEKGVVYAKKGAGTVKKSRFFRNGDGDVQLRKGKAALTSADEKRKRGDALEMPNKRVAVEGRDFAPLRARHAAPTSDVMGFVASGFL
ncbi:Nn.00g033340.m01.CDS01 [Neocucurbitaria sp. VM-36]